MIFYFLIYFYLFEGNTNGCLGTTFEILYFVVKKRITVWLQQQHFVFPCKKRMAVWVHALNELLLQTKLAEVMLI